MLIIQVLVCSLWFYDICGDIATKSGSKTKRKANNTFFNSSVHTDESYRNDLKNTSVIVQSALGQTNISTRPLRVFVYEGLPPALTTLVEQCELGKRVKGAGQKKDNFMADIPIINLFRTYPFRTWNPSEADVFVVPYPHKSHCMCNLRLPGPRTGLHCPQVPHEDIDLLISSLSYFNLTTMKRHLFVISGDYGWSNKRLEMMPLVLTLGPRPEEREGTIVIPYLNDIDEFQPSIVRQRSEEWWTKPRKYSFAYFYGGAETRPIRGLFREEVERNYGDSIGGLPYVMKTIKKWTPAEKDEVYETYRQSLFCPCLPGDNARE